MSDLKIAVIVADSDEYVPFAKAVEKSEFEEYSFLGRKGHKFSVKTEKGSATVYSLLCGIGMVNAAAAAAHFATIGCDIILNYGLSGGISGISKGEFTLGTTFFEHDFDLTVIGYKPYEKPNQQYIYKADEHLNSLMKALYPYVKMGTAVSGDRFICDDIVRNTLKNDFGAMSCDMETGAIAYVCNFGNIPFLSLRRISDDAGNDAGDSYKSMVSHSEMELSDMILSLIPRIIDENYEK